MAIAAANSSPTMSLSHSHSHDDATTTTSTANDNLNTKPDDHEHDMVMPGFRFHPTEEELVEFYLRRKVEGKRFNVELITFLDLYRYDPWELPGIYIYNMRTSLFLRQFLKPTFPPLFLAICIPFNFIYSILFFLQQTFCFTDIIYL